MNWNEEVDQIFFDFIEQIPEAFRKNVEPLIRNATEKKCLERNDSYISKADLITGIMECTPKPFESVAVEALINMQIDVEHYIKVSSIHKNQMRTWDNVLRAFHPGNYHFTMYLTDRCNQNCLHCAASTRQHREELSKEQWFDIIENVESSLNKQNRHGVYIWFGGEPTIRSDLKDIMMFCKEKGYMQAIATNGILFDDNFAEYCVSCQVSHVFISLDSVDPEKADRIRGTQGAYDYAKRAIQIAVKHGLFVLVTATVMKQNLEELEELKELIESWGAMPYFRAVIKQRSAADNWEEIGLDVEGYKKFYDFKYKLTLDAIRSGKAENVTTFSIYDMVPFMEIPHNEEERSALAWGVGCQACRTISGIDINGDVFPCDYPSNFKLGNLLINSFEEIMESENFKLIRDRKRVGKCASCKHLNLCGGGCRVHAESETGNFFESFSYCWCEDTKNSFD